MKPKFNTVNIRPGHRSVDGTKMQQSGLHNAEYIDQRRAALYTDTNLYDYPLSSREEV
jgi:hypothetical protein